MKPTDRLRQIPAQVRKSLPAALCAAVLLLQIQAIDAATVCDAPPVPAIETACQRDLRQLDAQLQQLLTRFTDLHPDVVALKRSIDDARACEAAERANAPRPAEDCVAATPDSRAPTDEATAKPPVVGRATDGSATITINVSRTRQSLYGFGSTHASGIVVDNRMTDDQWRRTVTALVTEIGSTTGVAPAPVEFARPRPRVEGSSFSRPINFSGTETLNHLFNLYTEGGLGDLVPTANINTRWSHPWLANLKSTDYARYLDEISGKALATVIDWKARTGREPEYLQLWNEPLSGNNELVGGTARELLAIIQHTGRRLREAGFLRVRFVLPNEETVASTLDDLRTIAQDEEARGYIGAIGYHSYPYTSDYSYVPRLLAMRAQGKPFDGGGDRLELRKLSRSLRIPVWMTEVSNGYSPGGPRAAKESYDPDSIDWIVGRAIHIHDEFRYAGVSAYYGMMAVWTNAADRDHFPDGGSRNLRSQGDNLVLVDTASDEVIITAMGHAIGHYGRWLRRGDRYLEADSSSPFVLVSPFLDNKRLVAVLVNTARTPSRVTLRIEGSQFAGPLKGEQSYEGVRWKTIPAMETSGTSVALELPAWSVNSVAIPIQ